MYLQGVADSGGGGVVALFLGLDHHHPAPHIFVVVIFWERKVVSELLVDVQFFQIEMQVVVNDGGRQGGILLDGASAGGIFAVSEFDPMIEQVGFDRGGLIVVVVCVGVGVGVGGCGVGGGVGSGRSL
jgi:hypothetical protein